MTQVYVGSAAMSKSRALGLTITPDPRVLNVGLAARPYHESMITKQKKKLILKNEIKQKKINLKGKNKAKHYST